MRILFMLAEFPYPPTTGPITQSLNVLKYIASHHECHILSFCDQELSWNMEGFLGSVPGVRILGLFPRRSGIALQVARIYRLLRWDPLFLANWRNHSFAKAAKRALQQTDYDLVHLEGISMASYIGLCGGIPTVISTIDAISLAYRRRAEVAPTHIQRAYRRFAARSIERFEQVMLSKATKVHVVSSLDCQYLRVRHPTLDVENVGIAVPEEVMNYPALKYGPEENAPPRILLWGSLGVDHITQGCLRFLEEVYPVLNRRVEDFEIVLLAGKCAPRLRRQIAAIPRIQYIEWVDDFCAELLRANVIVLPDTSGTGIKNRALNAMALGKTVLGSSLAFEGIPVENGIHCLIHEIDRGMTEVLLRALSDRDMQNAIGQNAISLMREQYTIEAIGPKWLNLYSAAITKKAAERSTMALSRIKRTKKIGSP